MLILDRFCRALIAQLHATAVLRKRYLPIYGLGHSMGCKLTYRQPLPGRTATYSNFFQ